MLRYVFDFLVIYNNSKITITVFDHGSDRELYEYD